MPLAQWKHPVAPKLNWHLFATLQILKMFDLVLSESKKTS